MGTKKVSGARLGFDSKLFGNRFSLRMEQKGLARITVCWAITLIRAFYPVRTTSVRPTSARHTPKIR
jgi:hypothetical protein